jgi:hypothetical protein
MRILTGAGIVVMMRSNWCLSDRRDLAKNNETNCDDGVGDSAWLK